jgi:Berberine and berberine like
MITAHDLDGLDAALDGDRSWAIAHPHGSGRVYPNFPDPQLDDWAAAYHSGNLPRLAAAKQCYDPGRLFHFPQAV